MQATRAPQAASKAEGGANGAWTMLALPVVQREVKREVQREVQMEVSKRLGRAGPLERGSRR